MPPILSAPALPRFIPPMLLKTGQPFDSTRHFFEVKWDGMRTLAFIDPSGYRLVNRHRHDVTSCFTEFSFLAELPSGTALDGELVIMSGGRPDLDSVLRRIQARSTIKVQAAARAARATFVVFDQLYADNHSIMDSPLSERRRYLSETVQRTRSPRLALSEGVEADGTQLFREATARGLEGVVAKRLDSFYSPGRRTGAWIKIKRRQEVPCAIIGFIPAGITGFESVVLAAESGGELRLAGQASYGLDRQTREQLAQRLWSRVQAKPLLPCRLRGALWVKPILCLISCLEWSPSRGLREAILQKLVGD